MNFYTVLPAKHNKPPNQFQKPVGLKPVFEKRPKAPFPYLKAALQNMKF
jgi:hypothetical protein